MILLRTLFTASLWPEQINNLEQFGFTLVRRGYWTEVWVEEVAHHG